MQQSTKTHKIYVINLASPLYILLDTPKFPVLNSTFNSMTRNTVFVNNVNAASISASSSASNLNYGVRQLIAIHIEKQATISTKNKRPNSRQEKQLKRPSTTKQPTKINSLKNKLMYKNQSNTQTIKNSLDLQ